MDQQSEYLDVICQQTTNRINENPKRQPSTSFEPKPSDSCRGPAADQIFSGELEAGQFHAVAWLPNGMIGYTCLARCPLRCLTFVLSCTHFLCVPHGCLHLFWLLIPPSSSRNDGLIHDTLLGLRRIGQSGTLDLRIDYNNIPFHPFVGPFDATQRTVVG